MSNPIFTWYKWAGPEELVVQVIEDEDRFIIRIGGLWFTLFWLALAVWLWRKRA